MRHVQGRHLKEHESHEPDVILDVVFERGLLFLVVCNLAEVPAHRVRIRFEEGFSGLGGARKMHRLALFRKLEFLAPRKSISVFLDRSAAYFARGEPTSITAAISWETTSGQRRTATVHHDLEIYRDLVYVDREVPQHDRPA